MQVEGLLDKLRNVGFEVVNKRATSDQLRVIGRVPQDRIVNWLAVIQRLVTHKWDAEFGVDVSKHYFARDGRVVYSWRLIFQANELATLLDQVAHCVSTAPKVRSSVMEQPLVGVRANRNEPGVTGKGAQDMLGAAVGPAAIARAQFLAGRPR